MRSFLLFSGLIMLGSAGAEPVAVHNVRGYVHGYVVVRDAGDKIIGSGDVVQRPSGNRVTNTFSLQFLDGSSYQETAVFSQRRTFRLLTYKLVTKGASFKNPGTVFFDTARGTVNVAYTDKDGKPKNISDQMALPPDLANGLIPTLVTEIDPKVETTVSLLAFSPKPRLVKLKIAAGAPSSFTIAGVPAKAIHYILKVDIGGATGVAAKALGKQPPPVDVLIAAGNAPMFLRSDGPLMEDGASWRIEIASPVWQDSQRK